MNAISRQNKIEGSLSPYISSYEMKRREQRKLNPRGRFPRGRVAFFVTSNIHKFNEARQVLGEHKVATAMLKIQNVEIQDNNKDRIAKASVTEAAKKCNLPLIVEDAGLFIKTLNGFPGPYSAYVYRTIGNQGILKLMKNAKKRDAYFHSVVAFCNPEEPPICFHGRAEGKISLEARGNLGFGFDPIFETFASRGKTFAEITLMDKNRHSHRAKALRKFARWYTSALQRRF